MHSDLAHHIDIHVVHVVQRGEDLRGFPRGIGELVAQQGLTRVEGLGDIRVRRSEDEQHQCAVPVHGESAHLPAGKVVGDIHVVVARLVAIDHAGGDLTPEVVRVPGLGSESQRPHCRVQAVGADDHVEVPRWRIAEGQRDAVGLIVQRGDGVGKQCLHVIFDCPVDRLGDVAARHGGIAIMSCSSDRFDAEARSGTTVRSDRAHLAYLVADLADIGLDPHLLGDVVAQSPEVDDVAAGAEARGRLNESHLVAGPVHPVGEGRPGDACAADRDLHVLAPYCDLIDPRLLRRYAEVRAECMLCETGIPQRPR